jgi:hypothetical protein
LLNSVSNHFVILFPFLLTPLQCQHLIESITDESSGGEEVDDEDCVDDVVSAVQAKILKKKKKNKRRKRKERKKRTSGVKVNQISEERINQQMENFSDLLRVRLLVYMMCVKKLQHVFLYI